MQRLRNLGLSESRIREIRDSGSNPRTIDWLAPAGGTVMVKRIINGQRVVAGDELYRIVDLSNVWVIADVAEGDLADIKLGTRADRDLPRLSQPAGRWRRHLHLSGSARRKRAPSACASKSPIRTSG